MPSLPLHPQPLVPHSATCNPLPSLLHTPSGLAIVELQGDIRFPPVALQSSTQVGKLVFPHYSPSGDQDGKWMKRVYFYAGKNQRMAGEVKKLGRPYAVVRKRGNESLGGDVIMGGASDGPGEELEIVDIVKYRIIFATRPEPVGGGVEEVV